MNADLSDAHVIKRLQTFFERDHPEIVCVYLYGSVARGTPHRDSDIDLAVLYAEAPPPTLDGAGFDLGSALEHYMGQPVDVVVLNRAPVDLIHRVLRDGQLLCDRNASARIRFEVQARNTYFDLLPYLRQYRRAARGDKP